MLHIHSINYKRRFWTQQSLKLLNNTLKYGSVVERQFFTYFDYVAYDGRAIIWNIRNNINQSKITVFFFRSALFWDQNAGKKMQYTKHRHVSWGSKQIYSMFVLP
jgi:hypothetical protein